MYIVVSEKEKLKDLMDYADSSAIYQRQLHECIDHHDTDACKKMKDTQSHIGTLNNQIIEK